MTLEQLRLLGVFVIGALCGGQIATGHILDVVLMYTIMTGLPFVAAFVTPTTYLGRPKKLTWWNVMNGDPCTYVQLGHVARCRLCRS